MPDLPFQVHSWSRDGLHIEELIATARNMSIARAAFDKAVELYPERPITLRHGAQLIEKHAWPG